MKHLLRPLLAKRWVWLLPAFLLNGAAQAQTTYCTTNLGGGSCVSGQLISAVSIANTTLNNAAGGCQVANGSSYATFPATGSTTATLAAGSAYSISVTASSTGPIGLWIDYNQNGVFDTSEFTQVVAVGQPNTAATATIAVPATATAGATKLRIRTRVLGVGSLNIRDTDACTTFTTGQTQDYAVTIGPPTACPAPTIISATSITATSASIGFSGSAAAGTYTLTYTPQGGGAGTITTATAPVSLTGLLPGTMYAVSIVSNCGSGSSLPGTVSFTTAPQPPANDDCAAAGLVPVTATCASPTTGTVVGATQTLAPTANCGVGVTTANDVWYRFVATGPSQVVNVTPAFNAVVDVRSGTCASSTSLGCSAAPSGNATSTLLTGLVTGTSYFVRLYARAATNPTAANAGFTLCITAPPIIPANDDCTAAITVPVTTDCTTPTTGTLAGATQSLAPTASCGQNVTAANDVWYSFTATAATHLVTLSPAFTGIVEVRTAACASSTSLACNTAGPNAPRTLTVTGLAVGTSYLVRIYESTGTAPVGTAATFQLCVTTSPTVPANDDPCGAIALGGPTPTVSTNAGATTTALPGIAQLTCTNTLNPKDVWFTLTPLATTAALSFAGTAAGMVRVYTAASCATGFVLTTCLASAGPNTSLGTVNLTGLVPGQLYYLGVSGYGPTDTPGAFSIGQTVLATRAQTDTNALVVFPNPSPNGQLTLRLSGMNATGSAALFNGLGQQVFSQNLPVGTTEHVLHLPSLATGFYTLRVLVDGQVLTRKVVLE